jgi:hypothetical protein
MISTNADISQSVLPAGVLCPGDLRDPGSLAIVFKRLSTDQGVLADERTFPDYSPVFMDSPIRISGHPGNFLIRN